MRKHIKTINYEETLKRRYIMRKHIKIDILLGNIKDDIL